MARRQPSVRFFSESGSGSGVNVLDCACGIGTQSLGLAQLGYCITGSDLSAGAVRRARAEAAARALDVPFHVADVRHLDELPIGDFEAVISMDNALPHLLSDSDLTDAARQMHAKLRPGGALLASIRDYNQLVRDRPTVQGPVFYSDSDQRRIIFQAWDWADDRRYTFHLYITSETPSGGVTSTARRCIALSCRRISQQFLLRVAAQISAGCPRTKADFTSRS